MIHLPPTHTKSHAIKFDEFNAIYLNIAKSASTSIKTTMAKLLKLDIDSAKTTGDVHKLPFNKLPLNWREKEKDVFKFTIVRNPWSRLVSCYQNHIHSEKVTEDIYQEGVFKKYVELYQDTFRYGMSFDEFANIICEIPEHQADYHFRSQYCSLINDFGEVELDYLGRLENMTNDFNEVANIIGLPEHAQMTHRNKTKKASYPEFYSPELIDKVAKRYAVDIHLFGYTFDGDLPDKSDPTMNRWKEPYPNALASEVYKYHIIMLNEHLRRMKLGFSKRIREQVSKTDFSKPKDIGRLIKKGIAKFKD